ncbi:MAG: 7-cyano-7-deazaguanine synthase, partial [Phycisphaerae bacterium]|nr:7-cyano-7-deazaguanine synthase [Phycisphaerae bacterium]
QMIGLATQFAVHYQAASIFCGLRVGNAATAAADNLVTATEFSQVWEELIQMPCGQPELRLEMPLLELDAWQVIDVGFQVATPMEKTWSCEENGPDPCWACRGCRAREAAFQQAAKPDPLHLVRKV